MKGLVPQTRAGVGYFILYGGQLVVDQVEHCPHNRHNTLPMIGSPTIFSSKLASTTLPYFTLHLSVQRHSFGDFLNTYMATCGGEVWLIQQPHLLECTPRVVANYIPLSRARYTYRYMASLVPRPLPMREGGAWGRG